MVNMYKKEIGLTEMSVWLQGRLNFLKLDDLTHASKDLNPDCVIKSPVR